MNHSKSLLLGCALLASLAISIQVLACPFCDATSQTLSQEIAGADISVIARLVSLPPEYDPNADNPASVDLDSLDDLDSDSGTAEFEVLETIHSAAKLPGLAPSKGDKIRVVYFGGKEDQSEKRFLINGIAGSKIDWTTPLPLSQRGVEYVKQLQNLPEKGTERIVFFLGHLEDEDPLLAQDAYDEFARAPYAEITAIADRMDRQELLAWVEDAEVGPTRRRLYLTMLGVCGQPEDVAVLESLINYDYQQLKPGIATMLAVMGQAGPTVGAPIVTEMFKADVRRKQQCLDALIAAYLKLKGPAGLPLIEKRFLLNPAAEYTHVYATIMALRFHGEETDSLPRERLLESVRLLLDNPEIADQVIPDLARWEDWTVMDRLVSMFKSSEDDAWLRQPVISYLLVAAEQPALEVGAHAEAALKELETLDPEGVKRARSYMSFGLLARMGTKPKAKEPKPTESEKAEEPEVKTADAQQPPAEKVKQEDATQTTATRTETPLLKPSEPSSDQTPADSQAKDDKPGPSRVLLIGAPIISGLLLFGVFALLLRGSEVRTSSPEPPAPENQHPHD